MSEVPLINVGILSDKNLRIIFHSEYRIAGSGIILSGICTVAYEDKVVVLRMGTTSMTLPGINRFDPVADNIASFTICDVTIGIGFHWERKEDQKFKGSLILMSMGCNILAINNISVEKYLESVISSEMSATASEEFLKAHAVISRSWLLAQIEKKNKIDKGKPSFDSFRINDNELERWYDREDHTDFDVCADDHCQRYQGITRASGSHVAGVIAETSGEILEWNGEICDARFYKCCGGVTELFENTWEPVSHPYLRAITDNPRPPEGFDPDLEKEEAAIKWISGKPDAFCNTTDKRILSQVLNDYDQETHDFFRWKVTYGQEELSELVRKGTGIDFGTITGLEPVKRGPSGRIIRLKVTGTLKTMIIGKELVIRKALSNTHLYSSCFYVEKDKGENGLNFIIHGAGWGHGVGLCQIGAAVMGDMGYGYRDILLHYFRGAEIVKRY